MEKANELCAYIREHALAYNVLTYGCQMNEHESEKIKGIVEAMGYRPAHNPELADLVVFNTCCIRDNAEQKIFGNIGALKKHKAERKDSMIVVCGCMTQQEETAKKLYDTFPFVDIILGTHNIHQLAEMIASRLAGHRRVFAVEAYEGGIVEELPIKRRGRPLASVNIMYGCDNFCSYCIVPYVRGRERSREPKAIIDEIKRLTAGGYREVMLLGQNVNSYNGGSQCRFPQLLDRICGETDIRRIRFMTSHPKDLSDGLIDSIKNNTRVCKHIHLPVQSGSTDVLQRMNRGYSREQYLALVGKLRTAIPEIVITTDVIVGFPGETHGDFEDTLSLLEQVRFDSAFTFVYSARKGTKAAAMDGHIAGEVQKGRIIRLIDLQNGITEQKNKAHVGKTYEVLVEDASTRSPQDVCGRTDGGKMVNFAGSTSLTGEFVNVKITQAKRTTLFGEMIWPS